MPNSLKRALENVHHWQFFKNQHILITGATGTIGKAMVGVLETVNDIHHLNIKITITTRDKTKAQSIFNSTINIVESDLSHLPPVPCDTVIHLASPLDHTSTHASDTMYQHAETILDFAKASHAHNIIIASSGAVYAGHPCPENGYAEDTPFITPKEKNYSHGKQRIEKLALDYQKQTQCNMIIGRIFAQAGKDLTPGFAFADFITEYNKTGRIVMQGDGTPVRSYASLQDSVLMMLVLLGKKDRDIVYNIGGNEPLSLKKLAYKITGDDDLITAQKKDNARGRSVYFPNMDKTLSALDYPLLSPIEDTILQVKTIKISVVIPTYNRKAYLKRAIDSILAQSYNTIEICVTDNASNDGTEQLCRDYVKKHGIFYNRNSKNMGPANNIRHGLYHMATGDYVLYMSDDDYLVDRDYFSHAVERIHQTQPAFVYGRFHTELIENGVHTQTIADNPRLKGQWNDSIHVIAGDWVVHNYHSDHYPHININCFIMRRDYYQGYDAFVGTYMSVDQQTKIKVALQGDGVFINRVVLHYTRHENNDTKSRDFAENCQDVFQLINDVTPYLENHYSKQEIKQIHCQYRCTYLANAPRILAMFGMGKALYFVWRVMPKNMMGLKTLITLTGRFIFKYDN